MPCTAAPTSLWVPISVQAALWAYCSGVPSALFRALLGRALRVHAVVMFDVHHSWSARLLLEESLPLDTPPAEAAGGCDSLGSSASDSDRSHSYPSSLLLGSVGLAVAKPPAAPTATVSAAEPALLPAPTPPPTAPLTTANTGPRRRLQPFRNFLRKSCIDSSRAASPPPPHVSAGNAVLPPSLEQDQTQTDCASLGGEAQQALTSCGAESELELDPEPDVLLRGRLLHVKGFVRMGPRLAERAAEIRRSPGGAGYDLVWFRLLREGRSEQKSIRLAGSVAEAVHLQEHPRLPTFRLFPMPCEHEGPLELAASTESQRTQWLASLNSASKLRSDHGAPVGGHLKVTVTQASLTTDLGQSALRRASLPPCPEVFVTVRCGSMAVRTATRRTCLHHDRFTAVFDRYVEFPLADDDPDTLVTLEVLTVTGRGRFQQKGRVAIPLYQLGRNSANDLRVPLRDPTLPRADGHEVGAVCVNVCFQQPVQSLLLPRPVRQQPPPWKPPDNRPLREQFRELESFLQEFEVFSNRFMHHCDTSKRLSIVLRRIVQWDAPLVTLVCLVLITLVVLFFHEHSLPIGVFALLCFTVWFHPACREHFEPQPAPHNDSECDEVPEDAASKPVSCNEEENAAAPRPSPRRSSPGPQGGRAASAERDIAVPIKERFENQRRLMLGQFTPQRLRFYDPPPWCHADGRRAEPPESSEDGISYVWRIDMGRGTDSNGWRYARHFGRNSVWRNNFHAASSFVRQRRHVGRPVAVPPQRSSSLSESCGPTRHDLGGGPPATSSGSAGEGKGPAVGRETLVSSFRPELGSSPGGKGPELGIARTPFHDMYQQYLLRWGVMQRNIEYWMDWYERRKNLFLGVTPHTQNFALLGVAALFVASILLPTRWLLLFWVYGFFYEGLSQGRLMRHNRDVFVKALKDTVSFWLDGEAQALAATWGAKTSLDEIADAGVQLLKLRDWIQAEFFEGRPMIPLGMVQRCGTLGELAVQVTWTSNNFSRRRQRKRVWYRSTFRNLLDHVPSDITCFQPWTTQPVFQAPA